MDKSNEKSEQIRRLWRIRRGKHTGFTLGTAERTSGSEQDRKQEEKRK